MKVEWRLLRAIASLLVLGALVVPWNSVEAQEGSAKVVEEMSEEAFEARQKKFMERMRVMRAWKLTEVLDLDEVTGARLFKVMSTYDERLMTRHIALRNAERSLRSSLREGAEDKKLRELTDDVVTQKRALETLRLEQFEKSGEVLDARRRAQLLLFIPRFDKEVRRALLKERKHRRDGKGKGRKGKRRRRLNDNRGF